MRHPRRDAKSFQKDVVQAASDFMQIPGYEKAKFTVPQDSLLAIARMAGDGLAEPAPDYPEIVE